MGFLKKKCCFVLLLDCFSSGGFENIFFYFLMGVGNVSSGRKIITISLCRR